MGLEPSVMPIFTASSSSFFAQLGTGCLLRYKIQSFGDMVDAVEKLARPIQEENERLHAQIDKMHKQMWWERIAVTAFSFWAA